MPLCACTNVVVDDSATDENSVYSPREATATTTQHDNCRVVAVDSSSGDNNSSSNHVASAVTTYGHDTSSAAAAESMAVAAEVGPWQPGLPLRVLYVTWNMAGRRPSMQQVHAHCVRDQVAHIIVVATQENGPYVGSNKAQSRWLRALTRRCLRQRYRVVGCVHQWALHLAVFARAHDVAPYISHVHRARVSTGMLHSLCGNKGAVAVAFAVSMQSRAETAATSAVAANATASPALPPLSKATCNPLTSSCEQRRDDESSSSGGDDACAATRAAAAPADVSLSSPCEQRQAPQQALQHAPPSSPLLLSSSSSPAATHMTVLCVNAHLPAHQHAVAHRSRGYQRIVRHLRVGLRGRYASWFAHMLQYSNYDNTTATTTTAATTAAANNNNNNTTLHDKNVCAPHHSRRPCRHHSRCRLRLHSRSSSRSSRARRHTTTTTTATTKTTTTTSTTTTTTTVHRDAASVDGCGCGCGGRQRRKWRHRSVRRAAATREEEPSQHDNNNNNNGDGTARQASSSSSSSRRVARDKDEDVDARCIQRHDSVSNHSTNHTGDSDSDSEVSLLHLPSLFPFFRRDNSTSRAATALRRRNDSQRAKNEEDVTEQFDITFFGGDLNYRLNGDRVAIERTVAQYPHTRDMLLRNDQLLLEQVHDKAFDGFREAKLVFRPTYKYALQRGTHVTQDGYTSTLPLHKQRPPAYCDRVLYKKRHASAARHVAIRAYTDVPGVRTSDHRPVMAVVDVSTRACVCDVIVRT